MREAALSLDPEGLVDVKFPWVDPQSDEYEVLRSAVGLVSTVSPSVKYAIVQGEATMAYHLTNLLKERGVTVLVACLKHATEPDEAGRYTKEFIRFRNLNEITMEAISV
jgi:hypothetical protein